MSAKAGDSITFFSKNSITCPVCNNEFRREDLRTGRGRLIAGSLTDELRRLYEPTEKYGEVNPLIYPITVCPACLYAAFPQDFNEIPRATAQALENSRESRRTVLNKVFPDLDFTQPRDLKSGVAAYHYAMMSMEQFPSELSPTIKKGICALRSAWLCNDLHRKEPAEHYDYLASIYYHKAWFFYSESLRYEEEGKEGITDAGFLGPDLDQNYGYDGVLYISALLEFEYGARDDDEQRRKSLERAKTTVGRLFGLGKATKDKPSTLLERAKDLHSSINNELKG